MPAPSTIQSQPQPNAQVNMEMPAVPAKAYGRTSTEQPRKVQDMVAEPVTMRGGGGGGLCCGLCAGLACFECLECCC